MNTETSNARGDVRGLVAKWRAEANAIGDKVAFGEGLAAGCRVSADELEAALAAEGVQAGEVGTVPMTTERAAFFLRRFKADEKMLGPHEQQALDFAIAALSQQPEARGVVGWCYDLVWTTESVMKRGTKGLLAFLAVCAMGLFTAAAAGFQWGTADAGTCAALTLSFAAMAGAIYGSSAGP